MVDNLELMKNGFTFCISETNLDSYYCASNAIPVDFARTGMFMSGMSM